MFMFKCFLRRSPFTGKAVSASKISHNASPVVRVPVRQIHLTQVYRDELKPLEEKAQDDSLEFSSLAGLVDKKLIHGFSKMGFKNMTPVQAKSIRPILETEAGIVARARTGTGKTLAFGIPVIQDEYFAARSQKRNMDVRSLIIAPTRDLALQISDEFAKVYAMLDNRLLYTRNLESKIQTFVGGESRQMQVSIFSKNVPSVVVATPGRLYDLLQDDRIAARFRNLQFKVLDEADRLLDIGFKEELLSIDSVLKDLNKSSRFKTVLFSATIDSNVLSFAKEVLGEDFVYVNTVDPNEPEAHEKIHQSLVVTENLFKSVVAAAHLVAQNIEANKNIRTSLEDFFKPIIFMPTVKLVSYFSCMLGQYMKEKYGILQVARRKSNSNGIQVIEFHGKLTQARRNKAVTDFKANPNAILVTSDVGARGMDFPNVSHVVQVCLPSEASDYIHRIGRTARGSSTKGNAVLFLTEPETPGLKVLEKRKIKFAETLGYNDIVPTEDSEEIETIITGLTSDEDIIFDGREGLSNSYYVSDLLHSTLGYFKSITGRYSLNFVSCAESSITLFNKLLDLTEKPPITKNFQTMVLGMKDRLANDLFYVKDGRNSSRFNDEDEHGGDRDNHRTSGDRSKNDRSDYRSNYRSNNRSDYRSDYRSNNRSDYRSNNRSDYRSNNRSNNRSDYRSNNRSNDRNNRRSKGDSFRNNFF